MKKWQFNFRYVHEHKLYIGPELEHVSVFDSIPGIRKDLKIALAGLFRVPILYVTQMTP